MDIFLFQYKNVINLDYFSYLNSVIKKLILKIDIKT